ncbi:hypothetical protein [Rivibacter subsaxonicus]|uniref:Outer membrane beta-barrel porin/alpha-amylase n=1 Tax=Rivibacter subsaxonicus TaxID=457575 RepID=A0A4Q7VZA8_9BURK|nr:hypothetical protein [Rivibacter subsaxonicus]RZU02080.1 hypothetical protein EV670_0099 [Rivibacter subsaxonicus]
MRHTSADRLRPLLAAVLVATSLAAAAEMQPEAYVFSPIVEQGELEMDNKAGISRDREGHSAWGASVGMSYGLTSWWAAELTAKWRRNVGESAGYDAWEWENRFQFTPTGRYAFELGFLLEIERPREHAEGWELNFGPLFQTEATLAGMPLQFNFNALFERSWRADEPEPTELQLQWQLRTRRGGEALDVGLQGFDHFGPWDDWSPRSKQSHVLGPALFGKLEAAGTEMRWELGLLFGTGGAAPRTTLRTQLEIEF